MDSDHPASAPDLDDVESGDGLDLAPLDSEDDSFEVFVYSEDAEADEGSSSADPMRWRGLGRVILAATPIGSFRDATPNLRDLLAGADVVAAEDTRTLRALLRRIGVTPTGRLISYHEHNERDRADYFVELA